MKVSASIVVMKLVKFHVFVCVCVCIGKYEAAERLIINDRGSTMPNYELFVRLNSQQKLRT